MSNFIKGLILVVLFFGAGISVSAINLQTYIYIRNDLQQELTKIPKCACRRTGNTSPLGESNVSDNIVP